MKLIFTLITSLLVTLTAFAQKADENYSPAQYTTNTCRSSFTKIKIEGENSAATIDKLLHNTLQTLNDSRCSLKLNYVNQSPGGIHYSFTQLFMGIPVYQSEIKVNTDKKNTIHSIFDNSYNTKNWNLDITGAGKNPVIAIAAATQLPVVATISVDDKGQETLSSRGAIIFQRDMNSYAAAPDSMVTGKVFRPDPLTSAMQFYGGMYVDANDSDAPWLDAQEQTVKFNATYEAGIFSLKNKYVRVSEFDPPVLQPATSTTPQFFFNRSQSGFEDVNAFYHLNTVRDHISSLGFGCADSLIDIDTHAGDADNSYFSYTEYPHRIHYGVGNVDDAEDADVCVHEYGHSLSYTAAPNSNQGGERNALDEAFGDYMATSYSKSISTFNDTWVFNWDGHNEFWSGRVVDFAGVYPDDLTGSIYHNGQIWSSALFSLNGDIGRDAVDSLILQTHYSYAQNLSMPNAAQLLIDADTLLNNGAYYCPIYRRLLQHKLVAVNPNNPCGIAGIDEEAKPNTFRFMQQGSTFTLFNDAALKAEVRIISITGQQVAATITDSAPVFNYQNNNIAAGIYLVNVLGQNSASTFKWLKVK